MDGNYLASGQELNLKKTFSCGQCFRWEAGTDGSYRGVAYGKALTLWETGGAVFCDAAADELPFWRQYFDLDADYAAFEKRFTDPPYLLECMAYGHGIRILRQEPWEALCSFILSQCNNIPRIQKIVAALCRCFGESLPGGQYTFPSAARIAPLSESDLAPLRAGYRTAYVLEAARRIDSGVLDLGALSVLPDEEVFSKIRGLPGVGAKVANCFLLYGLHKMSRFPVDVWMRRALAAHFPPDYDPAVLGPGAGLAQQYIFYYERGRGRFPKTENCEDRCIVR
ncbi:MAG: DNA-3-methyladenine glycosylase family protein [Oscillospiraceae bacterium]